MYVGVKAVLAKSHARIHSINLINMGVLPLTFADPSDYDTLEQGDELEIAGIHAKLRVGEPLTAKNLTKNKTYQLGYKLSKRQVEIILAGGLVNYTKKIAK